MSWKKILLLASWVCLATSLAAVTCTPEVIHHKSKKDGGGTTDGVPPDSGTNEQSTIDTSTTDTDIIDIGTADTGTTDTGTPTPDKGQGPEQGPDQGQGSDTPAKPPVEPGLACTHDCDCGLDLVCDKAYCVKSTRESRCPSCDGACVPEGPCFHKDGTFDICRGGNQRSPAAGHCWDDCDCFSSGQICGEFNQCVKPHRASKCLSCQGACSPGSKCHLPDKSIRRCKAKEGKCYSDCQCSPGLVCDGNTNTCAKSTRNSSCQSCTKAPCPQGTICFRADKSIGACGMNACTSDCDCLGVGAVCEKGECTPRVHRSHTCQACDASSCQAGTKCLNIQAHLSTCDKKTSCQDDCDCYGNGMVCEQGTCVAAKRKSSCLACHDLACKPGASCRQDDGKIVKCPDSGTFACGYQRCKVGVEYCFRIRDASVMNPRKTDYVGSPPFPGGACPAACTLSASDNKYTCTCPTYSCRPYKKLVCTDCACLMREAGGSSNPQPGGPLCSFYCSMYGGYPMLSCTL